jgi:hypothetical protein
MDHGRRDSLTRRDVLRLGSAVLGAGALSGALAPPADAQTPKRGGTFHIRGEDPVGFDPHLVFTYRTATNLSFTHSRPSRGPSRTTPPTSSSCATVCAGTPSRP